MKGAFEAKKHGYRQTQDGVVISFVMHPSDVTPDLAAAPLGTILMVGYSDEPDDDSAPLEGQPPAQKYPGAPAEQTCSPQAEGSGKPQPGAERPVAVALLNSAPSEASNALRPAEVTQAPAEAEGPPRAAAERRERDPTSGKPDRLVQWFGMACNEPRFQEWCRTYFDVGLPPHLITRDLAADCVRQACGVKSRAEFATNPIARQKALDLMADYDAAVGNLPEDRS